MKTEKPQTKSNAKRRAETMLAKGTAPALDYILARADGDGPGWVIKWRTDAAEQDAGLRPEAPLERDEDVDLNEPGDLSPADEKLAEGLREPEAAEKTRAVQLGEWVNEHPDEPTYRALAFAASLGGEFSLEPFHAAHRRFVRVVFDGDSAMALKLQGDDLNVRLVPEEGLDNPPQGRGEPEGPMSLVELVCKHPDAARDFEAVVESVIAGKNIGIASGIVVPVRDAIDIRKPARVEPKPQPATPQPTAAPKQARAKRQSAGRRPGKAATSGEKNPTAAELVARMMRQPAGATVGEISEAMGWLPHTTRAFISVQVRRKLGLEVVKEKTERGTVYRVAGATVEG